MSPSCDSLTNQCHPPRHLVCQSDVRMSTLVSLEHLNKMIKGSQPKELLEKDSAIASVQNSHVTEVASLSIEHLCFGLGLGLGRIFLSVLVLVYVLFFIIIFFD